MSTIMEKLEDIREASENLRELVGELDSLIKPMSPDEIREELK